MSAEAGRKIGMAVGLVVGCILLSDVLTVCVSAEVRTLGVEDGDS
jgi:tetrahydromethanopterin S-methyltransferase subunit G